MVDLQTAAATAAEPILNMVGEKVALGPRTADHARLMARCLRPTSVELYTSEHEKESKEWQARKTGFTIFERSTLRPIGFAEWRHIDPARRTADYGIIIGEKDCWGKGYGTETTIMMLEYAFTVLNLHSVLLTTYAYNERAIGAYTRAGFREIGRWREAQRLGDRLYDVVFMDCLSADFQHPLRSVVERP
jgi:RimJ/RimL family protein N-acetyltransferase